MNGIALARFPNCATRLSRYRRSTSGWVDRPRRRPLLVLVGESSSSAAKQGGLSSSVKAASLISGGGVKRPAAACSAARTGDVCWDANKWNRSACVVDVLSCAARSVESMSRYPVRVLMPASTDNLLRRASRP